MTILDDILSKSTNITNLKDAVEFAMFVGATYEDYKNEISSLRRRLDEAKRTSMDQEIIEGLQERMDQAASVVSAIASIGDNVKEVKEERS